jgi:polyhydroxyalkanoate synthesis repressor PhaR
VNENTAVPRIIKKYPNRRLYDTESSRYITIAEVRELVLDAIPFVVVEKKSGKDITRSVLLQIILEQELDSNPLFSNENLERFICYYGTGMHGGFSEFIAQGMNYFQDQQREFAKAMEGMAGHNPMTFWTDMTKKNLDSWNQMMGIGDKGSEEK